MSYNSRLANCSLGIVLQSAIAEIAECEFRNRNATASEKNIYTCMWNVKINTRHIIERSKRPCVTDCICVMNKMMRTRCGLTNTTRNSGTPINTDRVRNSNYLVTIMPRAGVHLSCVSASGERVVSTRHLKCFWCISSEGPQKCHLVKRQKEVLINLLLYL